MSETPTVPDGTDEPEQRAETPDASPEPTVQPHGHSSPEMAMGTVLNDAFSLYKRFFSRFFVLSLVVFLVLDLVTAVAAIALRDSSGGGALLSLIAIVVAIVGESLLLGALVFAVQDVLDGRADDSVSGLLTKARPYIGRLIGAGILFGVGVAVGLILLVVPGLYLLTIWAVFAPVIVLEGAGVTESFGRSRALVAGRFWPVFGVVLVAAVISAVAQSVVSLVLSFLPTFLRFWLGGAIASSVAVPFLVLAVTLTYFALRDEKAASVG